MRLQWPAVAEVRAIDSIRLPLRGRKELIETRGFRPSGGISHEERREDGGEWAAMARFRQRRVEHRRDGRQRGIAPQWVVTFDRDVHQHAERPQV